MNKTAEQNALMRTVLNDAEASLRMGNMQRAMHVIFVWSQRREYLLAGVETWESQEIGPVDPRNYALPDFMVSGDPPPLMDVLDDHIEATAPVVVPMDVAAAPGPDVEHVTWAHAVPQK